MRLLGIAGAAALVVTTASAVWLWSENRDLEGRLAASEAKVVAVQAEVEEAREESGVAPEERRARRGDGVKLLGAVGKALQAGGDGPAAGDSPPRSDDWQSRRERRQRRLREMLGRQAGETEEAYKERVAPMVQTMLLMPRSRVAERRREFEEAAGITDEQRAQMDAVLADTYGELVATANQAIQSGQLTPYRRNTGGVLGFVGGAAPIVEGADARLRQMLSKEQLAALDQSGFDLAEYIAFQTPWETLRPPPPE